MRNILDDGINYETKFYKLHLEVDPLNEKDWTIKEEVFNCYMKSINSKIYEGRFDVKFDKMNIVSKLLQVMRADCQTDCTVEVYGLRGIFQRGANFRFISKLLSSYAYDLGLSDIAINF